MRILLVEDDAMIGRTIAAGIDATVELEEAHPSQGGLRVMVRFNRISAAPSPAASAAPAGPST